MLPSRLLLVALATALGACSLTSEGAFRHDTGPDSGAVADGASDLGPADQGRQGDVSDDVPMADQVLDAPNRVDVVQRSDVTDAFDVNGGEGSTGDACPTSGCRVDALEVTLFDTTIDAIAREAGVPDAAVLCGTTTCGPRQTCCTNSMGAASCVDLQSDPNNCGMCNNVLCHGEVCVEGRRLCAPGLTACGSASACLGCHNLLNDPLNCGTCGNSCGLTSLTLSCSGGACVLACPTGTASCAISSTSCIGCSSCTGTICDPLHCGSCTACSPGSTCMASNCVSVLSPDFTSCSVGVRDCSCGVCPGGSSCCLTTLSSGPGTVSTVNACIPGSVCTCG